MIGQENLLSIFEDLINREMFPKFVILEGERGSGKKTLVNEILPMFNMNWYICEDTKVDTVRDIITVAYKWTGGVIAIPNCDGMSIVAQNAILKIVEEPPTNTYFIMTVENRNSLLPTIISRGVVYMMDRYTTKQIEQYASDTFGITEDSEEYDIVKELCTVPEEVNILYDYGILEFENYVKLVVDNIGEVSGANSFKIADKVSLKDGTDGYDLKLFWKSFINISVESFNKQESVDDLVKYLRYANITSSYLQKLRYKGANKLMLFDTWILDIRELSYE